MKRVPGFGPANARIMAIGEAPGANEEIEGKPFVGKAGQLLRKGLASQGIDPDSVYYDNLVQYRPPNNQLRAWFLDSGLPNELLTKGLTDLAETIKRIQPNVIIAFGRYPLWALTGQAKWKKVKLKTGAQILDYTGIDSWRGSILECSLVPGFKVIPTYHPAFILREGYDNRGTWACDLDRIKRESAFPVIHRPKRDLILDPQGEDRTFLRDKLLSDPQGVVTFDIEYAGSQLYCVGMTNSRDWAMSVGMRNKKDLEYIQSILQSGINLNAQNAVFDASILEWHYGMEVMQYIKYDTMNAAHAANPELPKGLDYLTSIYTDQPYYKDMVDWDAVKKGTQSMIDLMHYNAIDAWVQHEVMEEQWKFDLDEPEVLRSFQFEMQLMPILWQMSKRGVRIDKDKLDEYRVKIESEIQTYHYALWAVAGREINVKSPKDVPWFLHEFLDLPVVKMNKTGPATDDKTIAAVQLKAETKKQKAAVQLVRDLRMRRDLISKFLDVQFDEDGRMRGHYNPAGTLTGRLASRKFYPTNTGGNQQNIPRNKTVRSMFIPDPPKLFIYADLEKAESLVVAKITNDPEMLRVHSPGINAHKELAADLFSIKPEEADDDQYYLAKKVRHAGNYMQGAKTLMENINKETSKTGVSVTFGEAKSYLDIYRAKSPYLKRWWDRTSRILYEEGKLYNLVGPNGKGRKRIFWGRPDSILPEAVAYVPQSTVGDTLNVGLLNLAGICCYYMEYLGCWDQYAEWANELKEFGYEALMQVHDAVGCQINPLGSIPEKDADRALQLIQKLMMVPLTVPETLETFVIPVEVAVGPNWGELKVWKPTPKEAIA